MKNIDLGALKFWMVMITIAVVLEAFALAQRDTPTPTPLPIERPYKEWFQKWVIAGDQSPSALSFQGGVNNFEWLLVTRSNLKADKPLGFDPCYTQIESDYRPVVTQPAKGKWQIHFETVDLTKEFPDP